MAPQGTRSNLRQGSGLIVIGNAGFGDNVDTGSGLSAGHTNYDLQDSE